MSFPVKATALLLISAIGMLPASSMCAAPNHRHARKHLRPIKPQTFTDYTIEFVKSSPADVINAVRAKHSGPVVRLQASTLTQPLLVYGTRFNPAADVDQKDQFSPEVALDQEEWGVDVKGHSYGLYIGADSTMGGPEGTLNTSDMKALKAAIHALPAGMPVADSKRKLLLILSVRDGKQWLTRNYDGAKLPQEVLALYKIAGWKLSPTNTPASPQR